MLEVIRDVMYGKRDLYTQRDLNTQRVLCIGLCFFVYTKRSKHTKRPIHTIQIDLQSLAIPERSVVGENIGVLVGVVSHRNDLGTRPQTLDCFALLHGHEDP
jgi:hypothetical protein